MVHGCVLRARCLEICWDRMITVLGIAGAINLMTGSSYAAAAASSHVEKTWTSLLLVEDCLAKKVFLSMASNLSWSSCSNEASGDASPISLS